MKLIGALILFSVFAAPAAGQVTPYPGATPLEQHRYETQRLRAETDRREAEARMHRLETQARLRGLEAARQPPPYIAPYPAITPEQARAAREAATARRQTVAAGTTQIDNWLDRGR